MALCNLVLLLINRCWLILLYVLGCHKLWHPRDLVVYSLRVWSVLVGARSPAPHLQTGQRLASLNTSQPLQCLVTAPDLSMPQNIEWLLLDLSLSQIYIFRAKQNYQMPTSAARRGNPAFWLCRWIFVLCKHTHTLSDTQHTCARIFYTWEICFYWNEKENHTEICTAHLFVFCPTDAACVPNKV